MLGKNKMKIDATSPATSSQFRHAGGGGGAGALGRSRSGPGLACSVIRVPPFERVLWTERVDTEPMFRDGPIPVTRRAGLAGDRGFRPAPTAGARPSRGATCRT